MSTRIGRASLAWGTLVVLLALSGWAVLRGDGADEPSYQTAEITRGRLHQVVTATGSVTPSVTVDVSSQLSGRIDDVFVDFNDKVSAGQPIARLDQQSYLAEVSKAAAALEVARSEIHSKEADIQRARSAVASAEAEVEVRRAEIARAEADLRAADADLRRKETLGVRGGVTVDALDDARAGLERARAAVQGARAAEAVHQQAIAMARAELARAEAELANSVARIPQVEATLELARVNLDQTVIRSPIEGVVVKRDLAKGQTVAASLEAPKLFMIAGDLGRMQVHARVDEADIGRIQVGQDATFRVDAFPGRVFRGQVAQVRKAPEVTQNVVTYTVVIAAPNPDLVLLPGMTALVQVTVVESGELTLVPNAALRYASDQARAAGRGGPEAADATIWVVDAGGRPAAVPVTIGSSDATSTELKGGPLQPGHQVITGRVLGRERRPSVGLRLGF
jgi:HlyD family secretion protein